MPRKRKDYSEAVKMYGAGMSIQDVANFYQISRQAMWKILKRRGVNLRSNLKFGTENHFFRNGNIAPERVHNIFGKALAKGCIKAEPCEVCGFFDKAHDGRSLVHGHHDNYNMPLQVRWLCKIHHHEWHLHNTAIPLSIELPLMPRREICSLGGKAPRRPK